MIRTFSDDCLQVTVLESEDEDLCVIGIYRSQGDKYLYNVLANIIPVTGSCLILGDLNLCSRLAANHSVFELLRQKGFVLQISEATHIR